ncbi:hypothetical protein [Streptomyces sp. Caat 7-52]|uniref:hypothetical protein n=1 Tax=Streptomyces sp. Caat 7-52 TaxID=2949637 RepID=UPI0020353DE8|nr:hypothetical protein [Streptomyces sp. Caat 7-52]
MLVTSAVPLSDGLLPFLLAAVAGVLSQAARVALGLARRRRPAGRRVRTVPVTAAVTIAAVATALALLIAAGR